MISIDERVYREIAARLLPLLDDQSFFNGRVECPIDSSVALLICTLVLDRDPQTKELKNATPVWWEFHWLTPLGELDNDFGWSQLKTWLLHLAK